MLSAKLFNITTIFYMASTLAFFGYLASRNKHVGLAGSVLAWIGFAIHTVATGLRWRESYDLLGKGHAPLSNLYESVVFFAWCIVLIFGIIDAKYKYRVIGAFVMPFALLAMTWGQLFLPTDINPLMPALQSNWLTYHVITCFLGYAAFAVACGVSVMYLIKVRSEEKGDAAVGGLLAAFPPTKVLDELNYKAIMVGFPLLTLGIITGAAWANYAWGTYWSWDPKETWSLIVWFVYAAFLHARFTKGWVGRRAAWLSIIGFAATIFCYLGVNLLLSGLHSYGGL